MSAEAAAAAAKNRSSRGAEGGSNMVMEQPKPFFGCDLIAVNARDGTAVPEVVTKCIEAVERYGMRTTGLYRVSGMSTQIQKLRNMMDKGIIYIYI